MWVVNCKLYYSFACRGNCYIITKSNSSILVASTVDQWCISDEHKTSINQSCHYFFTSYCIWLIKWWFFFVNLGSTCVDEFYSFYGFIILIKLIILKFSNLAALTFEQWHISDDFETSTNQFCCVQCFVGFFKGSSRVFSFQLMRKVLVFCGITHEINIFILWTPLVSHISISWYAYHCVKIVNFVHIDTTWCEFSYFCLNTHTAMVYKIQEKSNTHIKWVC